MSRLYSMNKSNQEKSNPTMESIQWEMRLPVEAECLLIEYRTAQHTPALLAEPAVSENALFQFGKEKSVSAILSSRNRTTTLQESSSAPENSFKLIMLPLVGPEANKCLQEIQQWIERTTPDHEDAGFGQSKSVLLTLQGTTIIWQPKRAVVLTDAERMETVCRALLEASHYERELRSLEKGIDAAWHQTETNSRLAFEFKERDLPEKASLSRQFQEVISNRIRLANLMPQVIVPHVYPPTIASQIGERLRERTRMPERLELVDEKLDAQESVYEMISQRTSEYVTARKGHLLEWGIIIILLFQTVFWIIEFLSSISETTN